MCSVWLLTATLCLSNSAQGDNYHVLCVVDVVSSRVFWWQLKSTLVKFWLNGWIFIYNLKRLSFCEICYVQMSYVCMSSGDFELWIFVFFFLTEKINLLLTNQTQTNIHTSWNFIKLANHWIIYIQHKCETSPYSMATFVNVHIAPENPNNFCLHCHLVNQRSNFSFKFCLLWILRLIMFQTLWSKI